MLSTGSNELWVPAKDCDTTMSWCRTHRTYDNSQSESYTSTERKFHASIGESVLSGRVSLGYVSAFNYSTQDYTGIARFRCQNVICPK